MLDDVTLDVFFVRSTDIAVGIAQDLSIIVMVENRGENSYNTHISLTYPPGLSYRTFKKNQVRGGKMRE